MCKKILKNKKKVAVIILIILSVAYFLFYQNNETNISEETNVSFQELTNTDFSNIDPNMPEEVLNKLKENYSNVQEKLEEDQFDYDANMIKANILYQIKEYDKAVIVYQKLGELNSGDYASFKSLGDVYYAQKKYEEAEQAYLMAIKNNAFNPNVYSQLSDIYTYHLKDNKEGIKKFYENGIEKLGVNRFNLIQSYASYLESIGETENSIEQWKIISEEFPDNQPIKDKIIELEGKL